MAGEPLYPTEASSSESLASSGPSLSSGAFITNSQNFTIAGGHFTNVIQYASTIPSDFRTIPLGDLDLRNEIRLEESGMGKPSDMTVAIYQGERAEENWKCELSKYSGFRHPNFVQLYGTVNSGGLYATIFHDDLVPVKQFIEEHRKSVVSTVYLYSYFNTQLSV
ncbi:hypothetical protein C8R44DRAFT_886908 [Mycena epipterygia]|nr:hypothetical protein C8R44DRAFT_886908 [Mycena epipterygia]